MRTPSSDHNVIYVNAESNTRRVKGEERVIWRTNNFSKYAEPDRISRRFHVLSCTLPPSSSNTSSISQPLMITPARHTLCVSKCHSARREGRFFFFRIDPVPDPFHAAMLPRSSAVSDNPQSLKGHRELIKKTNG